MNDNVLQLAVVGINYKTSSIADREIFQLGKKEIPEALNYFKSKDEVEGVVLVSTCNRMEFYLVLKQNVDPFTIISNYYLENKKLDVCKKQELFYLLREADVANHLFHVITGLDSMLFGEYQVQGQIKDAYSLACSQKTADKIIHKLFHAAFRIGKQVRTETKIGSGNQSLSGIAFRIIKDKLSKDDVITIIGVNQNTKIIAEHLHKAGFSHLIFVNRTLYKAEELADRYGGLAFSLDKIEDPIICSKCIFSCTGADDYIIDSNVINRIYEKSKCLNLIVDMAVPRDINPKGLLPEIELIDLEKLKTYLSKQKADSFKDEPLAEKLISDELKLFEAWNDSQKDEYLGLFAERSESIRIRLMDEMKLQVSEEELQLLDKFSRSLLHRMKSTINQTILLNGMPEKEA